VRRVLIAGCGYVGVAVADLLHHAGWEVEGWTRSAESAAQLSCKPYPIHSIDISVVAEIAAAPAGKFGAIIHCASTRGGDADLYRRVYLEGAQNLLNRFSESRFLFTSSTSVYGQKDGNWVTEESPANPVHETGKILRETEQLVLGHGGIVVRSAGIYGPGRSALLKRFLNDRAVIAPDNDRFTNQVHRDDVAAALFLLLEGDLPPGEIYNVVDDKPVRQSECYQWLAERLHRPLPAMAVALIKRKRGGSNKRVSNVKLRALGWTPQYPTFVEGMEESVLPDPGNLRL
jgi:nucleoside-diphosphate-sugar epimerase